jgi:hypothetical protein
MAPNQVAFYLGVAIILFGLGVWFFWPPAPTTENKIKFLGLEVTLNTPAFVVATFGIVLIYLSTKLSGPAAVNVTHNDQNSDQPNSLEDYCGSGQIITVGEQEFWDLRQYYVYFDFSHGVEKIDPKACGRMVWVGKDNVKNVYLVDGQKNRISDHTYMENRDETLQLESW